MNLKLKEIKTNLDAGGKVEPITVRQFISWFGAQRRGYWIVSLIRRELEAAGLITKPDFNLVWIDAEITFKTAPLKTEKKKDDEETIGPEIKTSLSENTDPASDVFSREPTFRLSRFEASNQGVTSISSSSSIDQAITLMLSRRYSQLPIMDNTRDVKGVVSWESIGKLLTQGIKLEKALDAKIEHQELLDTASIFDAVVAISRHDYILVRSSSNREISGIMTATDLGKQFNDLAEPFLLLNEIENQIRIMLDGVFSLEELKESCVEFDSGRKDKIRLVSDLTFGEYIRLMENPERWKKMPFKADRKIVIEELEKVRQTRNDVMHFDPDGIDPESILHLRRVAAFLNELVALVLRTK